MIIHLLGDAFADGRGVSLCRRLTAPIRDPRFMIAGEVLRVGLRLCSWCKIKQKEAEKEWPT